MSRELTLIESFLGNIFAEEFATAILNKQLHDIGESRESFDASKVDTLLAQIETKVLKTFYKEKSRDVIRQIKKSLDKGG